MVKALHDTLHMELNVSPDAHYAAAIGRRRARPLPAPQAERGGAPEVGGVRARPDAAPTLRPRPRGEESVPRIEISSDFREFRGASVEQVVRIGQEVLADPSFPTVRAWRQSGAKAVGCFPVYTPHELVHSLGLLPVTMQGGGENLQTDPGRRGARIVPLLHQQVHARDGPHRASRPVRCVRLPVHLRRRAGTWRGSSRGCCPTARPTCCTCRRTSAPRRRSRSCRPSTGARREAGDTWPVARSPPDDLRASFALFNEQRALIAELTRLRREAPWTFSLTEFYLLRPAGWPVARARCTSRYCGAR